MLEQIAEIWASLSAMMYNVMAFPSAAFQNVPLLRDNPGVVTAVSLVMLYYATRFALLYVKGTLKDAEALRSVGAEMKLTDKNTLREEEPHLCEPQVSETTNKYTQRQVLSGLRLVTKPALTPDEARMRAVLAAVLKDMKSHYILMSRCHLASLLAPSADLTGDARDAVLRELEGKTLQFGLFDRAGRLKLALQVGAEQGVERGYDVVAQALEQAGLHILQLDPADSPRAIRDRLSAALQFRPSEQSAQRPAQHETAQAEPSPLAFAAE